MRYNQRNIMKLNGRLTVPSMHIEADKNLDFLHDGEETDHKHK